MEGKQEEEEEKKRILPHRFVCWRQHGSLQEEKGERERIKKKRVNDRNKKKKVLILSSTRSVVEQQEYFLMGISFSRQSAIFDSHR